jgi:hypothetical protein
MSRIKVLLTAIVFLNMSFMTFAQTENAESAANTKKKAPSANNAVLISPFYTALFPIGELSKRFGFSNNIGLNISFKVKRNWLIGVEGAYIFGSRVKENPIAQIETQSTGQIIGLDGSLGDIPIQLSGFEVALRVGKLIPLSKKHLNSGIVVSVAPGFIQHKIWINANTNNYPQLDATYKKGYDRLTNGAKVSAGLGYLFLEKKKFLSFYAGIDYTIGFTQERRNWNFDLMSADKHQRLDMLIGIKLVWNIPVFTHKSDETYYY